MDISNRQHPAKQSGPRSVSLVKDKKASRRSRSIKERENSEIGPRRKLKAIEAQPQSRLNTIDVNEKADSRYLLKVKPQILPQNQSTDALVPLQ